MIQNLFSSAASVGAASQPLFDQVQRVAPRQGSDTRTAATRTAIDTVTQEQRAGIRALNGGISIAQTVDDTAEQVQESVELRQMAVVAGSDATAGPTEPTLLEMTEKLCAEINALAEDTSFSGFNLTDGSQVSLEIQADLSLDETISVSTPDLSTESLGIDRLDLSTNEGARAALEALNAAIAGVESVRLDAEEQQSASAAADSRTTDNGGESEPIRGRGAALEQAAEARTEPNRPPSARSSSRPALSRAMQRASSWPEHHGIGTFRTPGDRQTASAARY